MAMTAGIIECEYLGVVPYEEGLQLQEAAAAAIESGEDCEKIFFLQHPDVFTIGRNPDRSSLGSLPLPAPLIEISRGGHATWHGIGQLVAYPILNLKKRGQDLHLYLRTLEQAVILACQQFDVPATRRESLTGVWVENRKLASIGVGVRHWISCHGVAINICNDSAGFDAIIPCGIPNVTMTNLSQESSLSISVETFVAVFQPILVSSIQSMNNSIECP